MFAFAAGYGFAREVQMYRDLMADQRLGEDLALLEDVEVATLEDWFALDWKDTR